MTASEHSSYLPSYASFALDPPFFSPPFPHVLGEPASLRVVSQTYFHSGYSSLLHGGSKALHYLRDFEDTLPSIVELSIYI